MAALIPIYNRNPSKDVHSQIMHDIIFLDDLIMMSQ